MTCDDRRLPLRSVAVVLSQSHGTQAAAMTAAAAAVASVGLTGISRRRRQWRRRQEFATAFPMRLSFLFLACVTLMACRPCQAAPPVDSTQQQQQQQQRYQRDIDDEDGKRHLNLLVYWTEMGNSLSSIFMNRQHNGLCLLYSWDFIQHFGEYVHLIGI
jgi:hypothetical protein